MGLKKVHNEARKTAEYSRDFSPRRVLLRYQEFCRDLPLGNGIITSEKTIHTDCTIVPFYACRMADLY